jgi:hypothetical protein
MAFYVAIGAAYNLSIQETQMNRSSRKLKYMNFHYFKFSEIQTFTDKIRFQDPYTFVC